MNAPLELTLTYCKILEYTYCAASLKGQKRIIYLHNIHLDRRMNRKVCFKKSKWGKKIEKGGIYAFVAFCYYLFMKNAKLEELT